MGAGAVYVYGFDDLTAIERDAVETLARIVGVEVTVSLTYEPARAALSARAEVVEQLRAIAARVVELPALDEHYEPAARVALHQLERSLFEPTRAVDPGGAVRLLEAGGERAEAELVAAEVLALLRDGVPAEEIVVVCRSLDGRPRCSSGCSTLRDSAREPPPDPVHPHRAWALGARAGALRRSRRARERRGPARLPASSWRARAYRGRGRLEAAAARRASRAPGARAARVGARGDRRGAGAGDRLGSSRGTRGGCSRYRTGARQRCSTPPRSSMLAPGDAARALTELDELGEPVRGPSCSSCSSSSRSSDRRPCRRRAAGRTTRDQGAAVPRRVRVRVGEGEFPPSARRAVPVGPASPRARDRLRTGPRGSRRLDRERYLLYACVSRAPSGSRSATAAPTRRATWCSPRRSSPTWRSCSCRSGRAPAPAAAGRCRLDPDQAPTERELARARRPRRRWREARRSIGARAAALRHVRHREVVSGGALESFANCPVKWLVQRELSPARFEPEPDALARGSYMHARSKR